MANFQRGQEGGKTKGVTALEEDKAGWRGYKMDERQGNLMK